jgi:phosphoesterase RecJ-like protein
MLTTQQISEIKTLLDKPKKIVITTHKNPDGDAMGSSLGLYHYLKLKGHKVSVITPTIYPQFLFWLPGNAEVVVFPDQRQLSKDLARESEIIFCLDFNTLDRLEEFMPLIKNTNAIKILIDHHLDPDAFPDYSLSQISSSSTCELVYNFIDMLGDKNLINKTIAECLYTGIMTDTGSFKFSSTSPQTHYVAAHLMEMGINHTIIHNNILDTNSVDRLRLLGYSLSEKLKILQKFHTAYIALTKAEMEKYHYKAGDTEGFVNYALSIAGIKVAGLFIEKDNVVKISLRSSGNFSVNNVCRKYFKGGGHQNAAGGISNVSLAETTAKFESILPEYFDEILLNG